MPIRSLIGAPTSRTEAFSDGVFAIAITILVLELHVPTDRDVMRAGGLLPALLEGWPAYLSYLATFLTIGNLWLSHHAVFEKIRLVDRKTQWLNLVLLLMVSLIPFPNAIVADYLAASPFSDEARVATCAYALVAIACVIPWTLLWLHLKRHPSLLIPGYTAKDAGKEATRPLIGALAYLICFAVALILPLLAIGLFIVVAIFFAVTVNGNPAALPHTTPDTVDPSDKAPALAPAPKHQKPAHPPRPHN